MHAEGKSPFVADDADDDPRQSIEDQSNDEEESIFAECPIEGCGKVITLAELDDHVQFHAAGESASAVDLDGSSSRTRDEDERPRHRDRPHHRAAASHASSRQGNSESVSKWKRMLHMPSSSSSSSSRTRPEASSRSSGDEDLAKRLGVRGSVSHTVCVYLLTRCVEGRSRPIRSRG